MDKIAALPDVAYSEIGALMLVIPVAIDGRPISADLKGQVITQAMVTRPPQARAIILAGRAADQSRADEVMLNESAALELHAHVGSVLELRGYRPDQLQQVMNGTKIPPRVAPGDVRVTGIIRLPTDLTDNLDAPAGVTYTGSGDIIATAAFFHQYSAAIGSFEGISFQLKDGAAGLPAFEAQVKRLGGDNAQIELGSATPLPRRPSPSRAPHSRRWRSWCSPSSWGWRCSWSWGRASSARCASSRPTSRRCGRSAPLPGS